MISKDVYWGDVDVFNEAHVLRTWVKKATTKEGRTQHRVMYYTPTLGQPALVAADGYRIHAAWDVPKEVLLPSKRVSRTVALIGASRRNKKVWQSAKAWLKDGNPMGELLSLCDDKAVCTVHPDELLRCGRQIERTYATDGLARSVYPVYLHFNRRASKLDVYDEFKRVGSLRAGYFGASTVPVVKLEAKYLLDALWVQHNEHEVTLAIARHAGTDQSSMVGIGAWMHRYALIMPLSMHAGRMPNELRAVLSTS